MRKQGNRDYHACSFRVRVIDNLYPIAPNAKLFTRFLRSVRGFCIMDPKNPACKDFFRNKSTMLAEQRRHARSPHRFVIHPFSRMNRVCRVLFFISWLWEYFAALMMYTFPFHYPHSTRSLLAIMNVSQLIVFVSFFFVGYVDEKERKIVIEPRRILYQYFKTFFVFDAVVVFHKIFFWIDKHEGKLLFGFYSFNYAITVLAVASCFVRYKCGLSILKIIANRIHSSRIVYKLCYHVIAFSMIIHFFTCAMFSIPRIVYGSVLQEGSWMPQANIHKFTEVHFEQVYSESLVIVVCFFFGASYDRYNFQQPVEQIILAVISIFGRLYTLHVIADFLRVFGLVGVSESKYEQYLGQLEDYMLSKHVPEDLRARLLKFYEYKLQKRYFNETQIISTLSETLRTELFLYGARKLIQKAEILKTLPKTALGVLFASMKAETFVQMDIITKAGGKVENVYFISAGTVAVIDSQDVEVNHLEDGDEFGLLVNHEGNQLFTHVAVESSEIYYLRISTLLEFLGMYPEVCRYFETRIKSKIEMYSSIGRHQLLQYGDEVLSSLRTGDILEKQYIRHASFDAHL